MVELDRQRRQTPTKLVRMKSSKFQLLLAAKTVLTMTLVFHLRHHLLHVQDEIATLLRTWMVKKWSDCRHQVVDKAKLMVISWMARKRRLSLSPRVL